MINTVILTHGELQSCQTSRKLFSLPISFSTEGERELTLLMMISLQLGFFKLQMSLITETELLIFHRHELFLKCACNEQPSSKKYKKGFYEMKSRVWWPSQQKYFI